MPHTRTVDCVRRGSATWSENVYSRLGVHAIAVASLREGALQMIVFQSSTLHAQASRSLRHIILYKKPLHLADRYLLSVKDASLFTMLHTNEW